MQSSGNHKGSPSGLSWPSLQGGRLRLLLVQGNTCIFPPICVLHFHFHNFHFQHLNQSWVDPHCCKEVPSDNSSSQKHWRISCKGKACFSLKCLDGWNNYWPTQWILDQTSTSSFGTGLSPKLIIMSREWLFGIFCIKIPLWCCPQPNPVDWMGGRFKAQRQKTKK